MFKTNILSKRKKKDISLIYDLRVFSKYKDIRLIFLHHFIGLGTLFCLLIDDSDEWSYLYLSAFKKLIPTPHNAGNPWMARPKMYRYGSVDFLIDDTDASISLFLVEFHLEQFLLFWYIHRIIQLAKYDKGPNSWGNWDNTKLNWDDTEIIKMIPDEAVRVVVSNQGWNYRAKIIKLHYEMISIKP